MECLTLGPKWLQRSNPLQTKLHRISSNSQIRYHKKWLKASAPEKLAESFPSRENMRYSHWLEVYWLKALARKP